MRKAVFVSLTAIALFAAGCAKDAGDITGSIPAPAAAPKPLLPAPPLPDVPEKPRALHEPECKALIAQMEVCTKRIKDAGQRENYRRRMIQVAETLGSMERGQRKDTCKADLPQWRKDCGKP